MPVVLLIAAVVILIAVVLVATGRGGELSAERTDHAPLDLGPVSATDVALLHPPTALWGYDRQATDEALERIAESIRERDVRIVALEQLVTDLSREPAPPLSSPYLGARHRRVLPEAPRPAETARPGEATPAAEVTRPSEVHWPGQTARAAEAARPPEVHWPGETARPGDATRPSEIRWPGGGARPAETSWPIEATLPSEVRWPGEAARPPEVSEAAETTPEGESTRSDETPRPAETPWSPAAGREAGEGPAARPAPPERQPGQRERSHG